MKKVFIYIFRNLILSTFDAKAGRSDMVSALKGIPGIADADFPQKISLWVVMSNPNAGHDFDQMGYMICNGLGPKLWSTKGLYNHFLEHVY